MAALVAVALAWGGLTGAPAQAADEGFTSWTTHTSEADPAKDKTDVFSDGQVHVRQHPEGIAVWSDEIDTLDDDRLDYIAATFSSVDGQPLVAGRTYTSHAYRQDAPANHVMAYEDGDVRQQFSIAFGLTSWEAALGPAGRAERSSGSPWTRPPTRVVWGMLPGVTRHWRLHRASGWSV